MRLHAPDSAFVTARPSGRPRPIELVIDWHWTSWDAAIVRPFSGQSISTAKMTRTMAEQDDRVGGVRQIEDLVDQLPIVIVATT